MDEKDLEDRIARALSSSSMARARKLLQMFQQSSPIWHKATPYHLAGDDILPWLNDQPETKGLMISVGGQGRMGVGHMLPSLLLERAAASGAAAAIQWLKALLATERATLIRILPLWGVDIDASIDLTDEIRLVPIEELPPSPQRSEILEGAPTFHESSFGWGRPKVALTMVRQVSPVFVRSEDNLASGLPFEVLHDVRKYLAVAGAVPIAHREEWMQFVDIPCSELSAVGEALFYRHAEVQPRLFSEPKKLDAQSVRDSVQKFLKFDASLKPTIMLAVDRFDRALRRHEAGDAAVDLSIALESLLGDGSTELTWKVSFRAALLGGGTQAEKIRRRQVVKALYEMRSKVVHTGVAPVTQKLAGSKLSAVDFMEEGFKTCSQIVRSFLDLGARPIWFEFELGDMSAVKLGNENVQDAVAVEGAYLG